MNRSNRHNLPPQVMHLMWLGLVRAPWLIDSLAPRSDGQRHDRPRDNSRYNPSRDY